jgi:16S rRNA (uracil1498-N3)-methyltransferase
MHRFFVDERIGDEAVLRGERAHQIANVLRLAPGELVALVFGGVEAITVLDSVRSDEVRGHVRERRNIAAAELGHELTLALPLLRGERSEEVVEAVTQLGVTAIVPFVSERSVVRTLSEQKLERWRRIARESAETARRGRVPTIEALADWRTLFERLPKPVIIPWEGEAARTLGEAVPSASGFSLVIGPEGGLGVDEIRFAWERGATTVTLGPRNLRSETAAIAAVAQAVALLARRNAG